MLMRPADGDALATTTPGALRVLVLVLDDENIILELLGEFLHRDGYDAVNAMSVEEAEDLLQDTPLEAVILDVRLLGSRKSGLDVLRSVRQRPGLIQTPAIILTGGVLSDEEQLAVKKHRAYVFHKLEGFASLMGFLKQLTCRDQPR